MSVKQQLLLKKSPLTIPVTMSGNNNNGDTSAFRCAVVNAVNFARAAVNRGISNGVAYVVVVSEGATPLDTKDVKTLLKPLTEQMLVGLQTHDGELACSVADVNASTFKVTITATSAIRPAPVAG